MGPHGEASSFLGSMEQGLCPLSGAWALDDQGEGRVTRSVKAGYRRWPECGLWLGLHMCGRDDQGKSFAVLRS